MHTLVMFVLQALLSSQFFLQCWDLVASTTREYGFFDWMFPFHAYRAPTSAELFFGLVPEAELYEENPALDLTCLWDLQGCGLIYGVLSGRQSVVGALMVGALTHHMFALSGSFILLVMR